MFFRKSVTFASSAFKPLYIGLEAPDLFLAEVSIYEKGISIQVQYKSTFNKQYVETEMAKNPDTIFVVSDEVANKINDPRIIPAGITNEEVTRICNEIAEYNKYLINKAELT